MTEEEIAKVAEALECRPLEGVIQFARMIAEHCAALAEDLSDDATAKAAGRAIRDAFAARKGELAPH